jgi:hypothetical protein
MWCKAVPQSSLEQLGPIEAQVQPRAVGGAVAPSAPLRVGAAPPHHPFRFRSASLSSARRLSAASCPKGAGQHAADSGEPGTLALP